MANESGMIKAEVDVTSQTEIITYVVRHIWRDLQKKIQKILR